MKPKWMLAFAIALLGAIHWPMFSSLWFPVNDGAARYQIFRMIYSEYWFSGTWPGWIPRLSWGIPADLHILGNFTPATWLSAWIGASLRIEDALLVYQSSLFLESLFFTSGLVLLVSALYQSTVARLAVVSGGILSLAWWSQPFFAFYSFYAFPWVFFLLIRYTQTGDARLFWAAGLVEVITFIGNIIYMAPIHGLVFLIFISVIMYNEPSLIKRIFAKAGLPYLALFLLCALAFALFIKEIPDSLVYLTRDGRNGDGTVSLETFRNFGRLPLPAAISSLFFGTLIEIDHHYYVGIIIWLFFGYALLTVRNAFFPGFVLTILVLFLLSVGSLLSVPLYYTIPGMKWVRGMGYLTYLLGFLVLIVGGMGMDHWMKGSTQFVAGRFRSLPVLMVLGIVLTTIVSECVYMEESNVSLSWIADLWMVVGLRVTLLLGLAAALYYFQGRFKWRWIIGALVVAGITLDLSLFQYHQSRISHDSESDRIKQPVPEHIRKVRTPPFAYQRTYNIDAWNKPYSAEILEIEYFINHGVSAYYDSMQSLDGPEWCIFPLRIAFLTKRVEQMISLRGGHSKFNKFIDQFYDDNLNLLDVIGCTTPKLLLREKAIFRSDPTAAESLFAKSTEPNPLILTNGPLPPPENLAEHPTNTSIPTQINLLHYSSDRLNIAVTVPGEGNAWLYYADSWNPHWHALVDGQEVPVYRANVGFKAILLPPGAHVIQWVYFNPQRNLMIHVLSLVGILFTLSWIAFVLIWLRPPPSLSIARHEGNTL